MDSVSTTVAPSLQTKRLQLRLARLEDDHLLFAHRSDERVSRFVPHFRHTQIEQTRELLKTIQENHSNGSGYLWLLEEADTGAFAGTGCLFKIVKEERKGELGYSLVPEFQGRGYAQEAAKAIVQFGFEVLGLQLIEAFVHKLNHQSVKVLTSNAFANTGMADVPEHEHYVLRKGVVSRTGSLARRLREVLVDGEWIANTNFADQVLRTSWKQATYQVGSLNTISALTFHINYYLGGVLDVLNGGDLTISDRFSFQMHPISSESDWDHLRQQFLLSAKALESKLLRFPDIMLDQVFVKPEYGTYQRNIEGVIEHSYYHLGQVVLIRKLALEAGII